MGQCSIGFTHFNYIYTHITHSFEKWGNRIDPTQFSHILYLFNDQKPTLWSPMFAASIRSMTASMTAVDIIWPADTIDITSSLKRIKIEYDYINAWVIFVSNSFCFKSIC